MAKKKSSVSLVHEFGLNGQHRIVQLKDGVSNPGGWTSYTGIAHHGKLRAATAYFEGLLPVGIFTTSHVLATVINA